MEKTNPCEIISKLLKQNREYENVIIKKNNDMKITKKLFLVGLLATSIASGLVGYGAGYISRINDENQIHQIQQTRHNPNIQYATDNYQCIDDYVMQTK